MKKLAALVVVSCLFCVFAGAQSLLSGRGKSEVHHVAGRSGKTSNKPGPFLLTPVRKGSFLFGVNGGSAIGYGSAQDRDGLSSFYHISCNPRIGYFLNDHFAVGLMGDGTFANAARYHSQSYGYGSFVRWYAGKMMREDPTLRKARFFLEGGATINGGVASFKNADGTEERVKFSNASPYIMPGFNYFFNRHFALEAGLQLSYTQYSPCGGGSMQDNNHAAPVIGLHYFTGR